MSGGDQPIAAVLVPARNEAGSIERCLRHVLDQDLPLDRLEVVVVDGDSTDGTGEIASSMLEEAGLARWLVHRNPGGATPANLNAGLALVQAPVVCRVDGRSLIPSHYVRTCAETLADRPDVVVVGGSQAAVARSESAHDRGIARALNNRYGMGLSRYRSGAGSGPTDTVYLGAFRTAELVDAGGWDERFDTNQDFELNRRMSTHGIVWFDDRLAVGYLPREALKDLWAQYHRFGRWKVRYWRQTGDRPRPRQWVLLAGPLLAIAGAVAVCRSSPRRWSVALAAAALAALGIDQVGSDGQEGPTGRATAVVALSAVSVGWLSGVLRGWLSVDR